MDHRFEKHYTREEARTLLPQVRRWLKQLNRLRHDLERFDKRIGSLMNPGHDVGGDTVNQWIRTPGNFDAVIDFDKAIRDPADSPSKALTRNP